MAIPSRLYVRFRYFSFFISFFPNDRFLSKFWSGISHIQGTLPLSSFFPRFYRPLVSYVYIYFFYNLLILWLILIFFKLDNFFKFCTDENVSKRKYITRWSAGDFCRLIIFKVLLPKPYHQGFLTNTPGLGFLAESSLFSLQLLMWLKKITS